MGYACLNTALSHYQPFSPVLTKRHSFVQGRVEDQNAGRDETR